MDRAAYNELYKPFKQARKRMMDEAIKRLQEQNPERFKELQQEARETFNQPLLRPVTRYTPPEETISIYPPDELDYHIFCTDSSGKEHHLFEGGTSVEAAIESGRKRWPQHFDTLIRTELCTCPACLRRTPKVS